MSESEQGRGGKDIRMSVEPGSFMVQGEGVILHLQGPSRDGIRTSDTRGWTAAADVEAGAMSGVSATGIPSHNEDLTLETCRVLVRRLNDNGATWGEPHLVGEPGGQGVDVKAVDTQDPKRFLQMQVVRAETTGAFWQSLARDKRSALPPSTANEAASRIWIAIDRKRLHAHRDVVLVLNAIRTPWMALASIGSAFRRLHGQDARGIGFEAVWIVGPSERLVEQLDR